MQESISHIDCHVTTLLDRTENFFFTRTPEPIGVASYFSRPAAPANPVLVEETQVEGVKRTSSALLSDSSDRKVSTTNSAPYFASHLTEMCGGGGCFLVVFLCDFSAILLKTTNNLDDDLASDFCSDCSA